VRRDLPALAALDHDVVVVGGGIYGAAVAFDAAQRGLVTALVEREDFASGASWNSLKTIHGGMRHLQRADVFRLRESAGELGTLLRIAPALVRPLPFLVPTYGHGALGREAFATGLFVADRLTASRNRDLPPERRIPAGRTVAPEEAERLVPGLERRSLSGAALWYDAQARSTERLTLGFVRAAAEAGALCANHAEAVAYLRSSGRVRGVAVRDLLGGGSFELRARVVVNAAGPWADDLIALCGLRRPRARLLRARNLVLSRTPAGPLAVGARSAGRFLFLVPWEGRTLVGTSYEPASDAPSDPLDFFAEVQRAFPWAGLERGDIALVHEGLVPAEGESSRPSTRSRLIDHETEDGLPGLLSLQGAKYTTARAEAERAVDFLVRKLGRPAQRCRTAAAPLKHARLLEGPLAERAKLAMRDEMALTLADAVLRRLDLGTGGRAAAADLEVVSAVARAELGWDAARERREKETLAAVYPQA
jgi:glycerol-3-phosphate dehydrogenase